MTTSATPPATRRIARSYLTDLVAAIPAVPLQGGEVPVMAVVEQLLGRAVVVRHVLRSDQLVLTFDLADDPAGWSTTRPAEPPLAGQQAGLANGGPIVAGGTYVVGERGPELLEPPPQNSP